MPTGRTYYSLISQIISHVVWSFCEAHELPCYTSGEAGTYIIMGHVVAPDFAYKQTPMSKDYPDPEPPLWVVEVISPSEKATDIRNKRQIYVDAGILYWEVYVEAQYVDVYAPGLPMKTCRIDNVLNAGDVLPLFQLPVKRLFKE